MGQAKSGDRVTIHFTGKTPEGEVFATSQGNEPLEFQIGEGQLLPGVEKGVEGMEEGQHKTIEIAPDEGFGQRREELLLVVERSEFPEDFEPEPGMELQAPQPDGSVAYLKILEVHPDKVRLDANHPLAGETLTFEVELLSIA